MKRLLNTTSILAVATFFASPALAADIYKGGSTKDAPVAGTSVESVNWGGVYFGAHAGYGWGQVDATRSVTHQAGKINLSKCSDGDTYNLLGDPGQTKDECEAQEASEGKEPVFHGAGPNKDLARFDDFQQFDDARSNHTLDLNGWFGGADLSYKIMVTNRLILEPFVDVSDGGGKGSASFERKDVDFVDKDGVKVEGPDGLGLTEEGAFSFQKRWGGTLGLKGGVLLTSHDYVYALAGLAYGSFKIKGGSAFTDPANSPFPESSYDQTDGGWGYTVGGGYERALDDHWHLGVEGRWTAIDGLEAGFAGQKDGSAADGNAGQTFTTSEKVSGDYGEWSVLGRISYKIGN